MEKVQLEFSHVDESDLDVLMCMWKDYLFYVIPHPYTPPIVRAYKNIGGMYGYMPVGNTYEVEESFRSMYNIDEEFDLFTR